MSWIRSSDGLTLLAVLVFAFAVVGVATAATVTADAPADARVGEEISVSVTVSDVYEDADQWTLQGTTELRNVTGWEVTKVTPSGATETRQFDGETSFEVDISQDDELDHVNISITGDAPPVESYTYDPPQTFVAAEFARVQGNNVNEIDTITVHHYTNESRDARNTIDEAWAAANNSGSDEAQSDLDGAISSYENENFPNAINLSESAITASEETEQSQQTTQLIMYAVAAVIVLGLIGGGIYYWQSRQDDYDKLR